MFWLLTFFYFLCAKEKQTDQTQCSPNLHHRQPHTTDTPLAAIVLCRRHRSKHLRLCVEAPKWVIKRRRAGSGQYTTTCIPLPVSTLALVLSLSVPQNSMYVYSSQVLTCDNCNARYVEDRVDNQGKVYSPIYFGAQGWVCANRHQKRKKETLMENENCEIKN